MVEIDWRLPARLRRPVHQELQRQRRRRRQHEAIVQFKRHSLYPEGKRTPALKPAKVNIGAEHHTGDVYREGRPFLAASVPPYAGSFLSGKAPVPPPAPKKRPAAIKASLPPTPPPARRAVVSRPKSSVASLPAQLREAPRKIAALSGERDVPYQWAAAQVERAKAAPVSVAPPRRRRFALPLHVSIWPFKAAAEGVPTSKKKVRPNDSLTSSSL